MEDSFASPDGNGKKGWKKRLEEKYEGVKDGFFADYSDGVLTGLDAPMTWGEYAYRGWKQGKTLDEYEPVSTGLKRYKAFLKRRSREGKAAKRTAANVAGQITGSIAGSMSFGAGYAANGVLNGIRMLKRKLKKQKI